MKRRGRKPQKRRNLNELMEALLDEKERHYKEVEVITGEIDDLIGFYNERGEADD